MNSFLRLPRIVHVFLLLAVLLLLFLLYHQEKVVQKWHESQYPMAIPTHYIRSGDYNLAVWAYNLQDNNGLACLTMLHGNSLPTLFFKAFIELHNKANQCIIAFDLPGHGLTGKAKHVSFVSFLHLRQAFADVLLHFNLDKHPNGFVPACWGYGCNIATTVLASTPFQGHRGFIMSGYSPLDVNGHFDPENIPELYPHRWTNELWNLRDDNSSEIPHILLDKLPEHFKYLNRPLKNGEEAQLIRSFFSSGYPVPRELRKVAQLTDSVRSGATMSILNGDFQDEVKNLSSFTVPILYMYGTKEQWITEVRADAVAKIIPNLYAYIKLDTGHAIFTEDPHRSFDYTHLYLNALDDLKQ